jgi:hypothetical protein
MGDAFVSHAIRIHLSRVVPVHVDDILADSFPASDPPSWTLGYVSLALASDESGAPAPDDSSQPRSSEDHGGDAEADDDSRDVNESGHEGRRGGRRIKA